ncbi:MAG TPA: sterol desaturase family protein [Gallionellaceae bacterium]
MRFGAGVVAILYLMSVHPLAFLIFQTLSTAYNVYGHCGREFYPKGMASHWLGRWVNTSTAHEEHHARGRYNYGLYFLFWDRMMGTVDPACKQWPTERAGHPASPEEELRAR